MSFTRFASTFAASLFLAAALSGQTAAQLAQQQQQRATAKQAAHADAVHAAAQAQAQYQKALDAINAAQWQSASKQMAQLQQRLAELQAKNADGALYWQAYADSKLGRQAQSLAVLQQLKGQYPHSDWNQDAAALKMQLDQARDLPASPAAQKGDDLKLLALNGLMRTDSSKALPLLQKVINGTSSPEVKDRALFVLAQNHSPEALAELTRIAESSPDAGVRTHAIRYLGISGGAKGLGALKTIYAGNATPEAKASILRAFMVAGDKADLLAAAKDARSPDLQQEAIRYLSIAGGKDELWQLYQSNPPTAAKASIIRGMAVSGDLDHLIPLAKAETNPQLRADAIHALGISGSAKAQAALSAMYTGAHDRAGSEAIIQALFIHNSAAALVDLARKETDPKLKRDIVGRISLMHSPVATSYLMEILSH